MIRKKTDNGFVARILKVTRKKVDNIAEEAYSKGWTKNQLYSKRGKLKWGPEWGLISFLDKFDKIIEVTEQYIAIESKTGGKMRFFKSQRNP